MPVNGHATDSTRRFFPASRSALAALTLCAAFVACSEPLPRPMERPSHLDTISFAPELGIDRDQLDRVVTKLYATDVVEGRGALLQKGDRLVAHIEGWLPSGEKIIDSRAAGEPIEFSYGLGDLVRGLDLGMEGMRVGGKRRVIVPPAMAYGVAGTDRVPPYATIIFEVEILELLP